MKKIIIPIILSCMLLLSGCFMNETIEYYGMVTTDYDLDDAYEMIAAGDAVVAEMSLKETVTREEYAQFFLDLVDIYVNNPYSFNLFFPTEDIEGLEDGTIATTTLRDDVFCPTIFHEGMEISQAYVDTDTYEMEVFGSSFLVIEMIYTGDNELFQDFKKTYVYRKNLEYTWDFYAIGDNAIYIGEDYSPTMLPLKEDSGIGE